MPGTESAPGTEIVPGWEARVAFITGAASGIGLWIAQAFVEAGMRVALGYRSEGPVAVALESFGSAVDRVVPVHVEVTDRASVASE